ncbi:MAG TPA: hypothetical protein VL522_00680 [Bordetella sp.]|jgi:hypothetical protein|nr:hypothetical protein [Bordetella sp.]
MFNYFSELEALQYLDMDNRPPQQWTEDRNRSASFRHCVWNFLRIINFRRIPRRTR